MYLCIHLSIIVYVPVAYEWWSLTRGSKYSDLTGESMGNFRYAGKLVAEERWSQPEVRLYCVVIANLNCNYYI